jgi:hypothetical protein
MLGRLGLNTRRGAGAVGLLLQLVASVALPAADAALDADNAALPVHVESPHSENCPATHDHLFCQVVRSLAAVSAGGGAAPVLGLAPPVLDGLSPLDRLDAPLRPTLRGPTAPRPPPFLG